MFLEVGVEAQDFTIVFEPGGLDPGDIVVFWGLPLLLEGEVADGLAHLVDEVLVDVLLQELSLFLLRSVKEVELLGLVEVLLVRIVEHVPRQKRNFFRKVRLHSEVIFLSILVIN